MDGYDAVGAPYPPTAVARHGGLVLYCNWEAVMGEVLIIGLLLAKNVSIVTGASSMKRHGADIVGGVRQLAVT